MNFQSLRASYLLILIQLKQQPFWRTVWGEFLQKGFFTLLTFRGEDNCPSLHRTELSQELPFYCPQLLRGAHKQPPGADGLVLLSSLYGHIHLFAFVPKFTLRLDLPFSS